MSLASKKSLRGYTYLAGFFFTLSVSIPAYLNSSFLSQFVRPEQIGIPFALAALLTIITISFLPKLLRFGEPSLLFYLAIICALFALTLPLVTSTIAIIICFIGYYVTGSAIQYTLDMYLEGLSADGKTGNIRGLYLTCINLGWLVSPYFATHLLAGNNYWRVYVAATLALLPFLITCGLKFRHQSSPRRETSILTALSSLGQHRGNLARNLSYIITLDFLLQFFYSTMVIYMPLYLLKQGLSLAQIGIVFSFMLIPFVLVDYPLGKLADSKFGEQELLLASLALAGLATASISFFTSSQVWLWALILFATRVGASIWEIMKETYLFKQVSAHDAHLVSLSRMMPSVAYLAAPILMSILLAFISLQYVFLVLGGLVLLGLWPAWKLEDTN